jgi:hypothetical protein
VLKSRAAPVARIDFIMHSLLQIRQRSRLADPWSENAWPVR